MIATNVICKTVTAQRSLRFIVQLQQNVVNTVSYFLVWRLYCLPGGKGLRPLLGTYRRTEERRIRSTATVVTVCVKAKPRNGAQRRTTAQRRRCAVVPLCAVAWFLQTAGLGLCKNYSNDLHKVWWKSGTWTTEEIIRFWWWSGSRL